MLLETQQVPVNEFTGKPLKAANVTIPTATVKRRKCGTGPFDDNWLNLDCCGLFCALITYGLHLYAIYAVCLVLLPPWMSDTDDEGVRHLSWMGHFTRLSFSATAVLAMAAHFKAMTTDPGAVPPDAAPLEEPMVASPTESESANEASPQQRGKRLCRRCKTFKPKRAHHCSVCGRCIIKMDRKYLHNNEVGSGARTWNSRFSQSMLAWNRPLPLGQQLCGYWQPQVFFAICFLYLLVVSLFLHTGHGALLHLHESAWSFTQPSFNLSRSALSTLTDTGTGGRGYFVWHVHELYDH
jgi:DHHC palmitoyltransferase